MNNLSYLRLTDIAIAKGEYDLTVQIVVNTMPDAGKGFRCIDC